MHFETVPLEMVQVQPIDFQPFEGEAFLAVIFVVGWSKNEENFGDQKSPVEVELPPHEGGVLKIAVVDFVD